MDFQSWVDRARGNFEKGKKHHVENPVDGGEDSGAIAGDFEELAVGEDGEGKSSDTTT